MIPSVTPTDMQIGPCAVNFNAQDLGGTAGDVKVTFKYDMADLMADQFGKTKLDSAISGMSCQVTTEFLEIKNKVNFQKAFPNLILGGTEPHQYVDMKDQTAVRQLSLAAPLILHPINDASSNADEEWYFWLAVADSSSEVTFSPSKQMNAKIIWNILLDTSPLPSNPARMFRYGNHSL